MPYMGSINQRNRTLEWAQWYRIVAIPKAQGRKHPSTPCRAIPHAASDQTFCSLRKVVAARARGARRPSGAEEGGGSASPTSRNEQQT